MGINLRRISFQKRNVKSYFLCSNVVAISWKCRWNAKSNFLTILNLVMNFSFTGDLARTDVLAKPSIEKTLADITRDIFRVAMFVRLSIELLLSSCLYHVCARNRMRRLPHSLVCKVQAYIQNVNLKTK